MIGRASTSAHHSSSLNVGSKHEYYLPTDIVDYNGLIHILRYRTGSPWSCSFSDALGPCAM